MTSEPELHDITIDPGAVFDARSGLVLDGRLGVVAAMALEQAGRWRAAGPEPIVIADIACDHAKLAAYLWQHTRGMDVLICAGDANPRPLLKAEATLHACGVPFELYSADDVELHTDKVALMLSDGTSALQSMPTALDAAKAGRLCVVIAGLGGEQIVQIMCRSALLGDPGVCWLLQPMSRAVALRGFLAQNGFPAPEEQLACTGGEDGEKPRWTYPLMRVSRTAAPGEPLTPLELAAGRDILRRRPRGFDNYIRHLYNYYNKKVTALALLGESEPELQKLADGLLAAMKEPPRPR